MAQTIPNTSRVPLPLARLKRAMGFVWRSSPRWASINLALLAIQSLLPPLGLYLTKQVINSVLLGLQRTDVSQAAFTQALFWISAAAVVAVAIGLCRALAGFVSTAQAQIVTDHMQDVLHRKSIEVDLDYYENTQYYEVLHRAQREAPNRPTQIVRDLGTVLRNVVSLIAIGVLLLSFHWSLPFILLLATVPGVVLRLRSGRELYEREIKWTPSERRSWYYNWLLMGKPHAKEIRLLDLGPLFIRRYRDVRQEIARDKLRIARKRAFAEFLTFSIGSAVVFGAYAVIAYRVLQGQTSIGDMVMFIQASQLGQSLLLEMLAGLAALYEHNLFLHSVDEFLNLKPTITEPSQPAVIPQPIREGLRLDNVSFRYSPDGPNVLDNISMNIPSGSVIALVGPNGSGKTSLIKLLCRLHDPTSGSIRLDSIDLRDFSVTALRRQIAVVFQDYAQYHVSARENIWFGDVRYTPDDPRIAAAARQAGADAVVEGLRHKYDTVLSNWFDDGQELSIGQWQKIALARAFFPDAQLVILDEPSSALDATAEYDIFSRFRQLMAGRTAFLVSHRFMSVKDADCIYVMDSGRILEYGSHDELLRLDGLYASMYNKQAAGFK
jgi:ATP-binding cassette, subfamily B, bacterial